MSPPFHIEYLRKELDERKRKNSRYSLRAFSRSMRIDPAALSRIMNGKQELSPKACPQILRTLGAPPADCEKFIASVLAERRVLEYADILSKVRLDDTSPKKALPRALYEKMANEYHSKILALAGGDGCQADPAWIAKQIATTDIHVEWIVSVMIRAGLLEKIGNTLRVISRDREEMKATENLRVVTDLLVAGKNVRIDSRKLAEAQHELELFLSRLETQLAPENESKSRWVSAQLLLRG